MLSRNELQDQRKKEVVFSERATREHGTELKKKAQEGKAHGWLWKSSGRGDSTAFFKRQKKGGEEGPRREWGRRRRVLRETALRRQEETARNPLTESFGRGGHGRRGVVMEK